MTQLARGKGFKRQKIKELAWLLPCVVLFRFVFYLTDEISPWDTHSTCSCVKTTSSPGSSRFPMWRQQRKMFSVWRSSPDAKHVISMLTSPSTWSFACEKQEGLQRNKVTSCLASSQRTGDPICNCKIPNWYIHVQQVNRADLDNPDSD